MIRADLDVLPDPIAELDQGTPVRSRRRGRAKGATANPLPAQPFPPPGVPSWARASGRAGEGDPLFFAGAGLALLDAVLRRDPPYAGALRHRLALQTAAANARMLRLRADEAVLRDFCFTATVRG